MRIQTKICGISTAETLDAAIAGDASHVGFVFFPKSPRYVAVEQAAALARRAAGRVKIVGLFVDVDQGLVKHAAQVVGLNVLQLHGKETPEIAASLKQATDLEIWKAIAIRTRSDLDAASSYRSAVDRILYDAKPPARSELPGGNGLRFDWTLLKDHVHPLPWALSGGLDPRNVVDAIGITSAKMVDVSSGVESAPGVKDVDKIAAFLQAVASL